MRKTIAAVEAEIGISDDISPSAGSPDENYNHNHSHSNHHPGGTGGSNDAGSCSDVPKDARVVFDMARVSIVAGRMAQASRCVAMKQGGH